MQQITDIFFDLDHTLWDFDKNSGLAFEAIFKENHPDIDVQSFIAAYVPINQACWKLYQVDQMTHEELRYKRLRDSFDQLGYAITDATINQISEDYISFLPENNLLFEGALEVLGYLKQNYRLHVITNGFAEVQYKKIKNSGIDGYFTTITNSEMAGAKKPHPKIYTHALRVAQTSKDKAVMIGDCLDADVKGALDFGIGAIFFNPDKKSVPFNVQSINHLLELKSIF